MSEKKVLLRFHLGNERERKTWELLLNRKQQDGCPYGDVVMDAVLASEDHVTEISLAQENRIVDRIKGLFGSCTIQTANPDALVPATTATSEIAASNEVDSYALVDWDFAGSGND